MIPLFTNRDISFFLKIVQKAGITAKRIQRKELQVDRKEDSSIVTQADLLTQEYLINRISKRFHNINFIFEEKFDGALVPITDDTISVVIDPIDGTSMYSMYMPLWCVSVGVFYGDTPLYGFVYAPGLDMFFHNDNDSSFINRRTVHVSPDFVIDAETNIFYATEIYKNVLVNFPGKARNLGSTALHACLTIDNARNRTLAFIGKSYLWDWSGAIPIILKAGGAIKFLNGENFNFSKIVNNNCKLPDYLIAYTHHDFNEIKKIFSRVGAV